MNMDVIGFEVAEATSKKALSRRYTVREAAEQCQPYKRRAANESDTVTGNG